MAYNKNLSGDLASNYTMTNAERDKLLASLVSRLSAVEKNPLLNNLPPMSGNFTLQVAKQGSNMTYSWVTAADPSLPKAPSTEGTFVLSATDEEGDMVYTWSSAD